MIKIFNQVIMTEKLFHQEKRASQKEGFEIALSKYKECDVVIKGEDMLLKGKAMKKLVILGDRALIIDNYFKSIHKEGTGMEIY